MDLNSRIAALQASVYGPHPSPEAEAELAGLLAQRAAERAGAEHRPADVEAAVETRGSETGGSETLASTATRAAPSSSRGDHRRSSRTDGSRRRLTTGIVIGSVAGLVVAGVAAIAVPALAPHSSLEVFLTVPPVAPQPGAAQLTALSPLSTYAQGPIRHLGEIRGTQFYGSIVRQSLLDSEGPTEGVCLIAVTGEGDSAWTTASCAERSIFDASGVSIEHTVAGSGAFSRAVDGRPVAVAWGPTGGLRETLASPDATPRPVVE